MMLYWLFDTTGPMATLPVGSPTVTASAAALAAAITSSMRDAGTSRRDPALQVWPELPIMPPVAPATLAASASSSSTMKALLPPSSSPTRLIVVAASFWICTPTGSDPVKDTMSTSSWVDSAVPITLPLPCTMLNTPAGTPAVSRISARIWAEKGASCGGFRIMVQPVASAGKILTQVWFIGQFHGVMSAQTPIGSRAIMVAPCCSSNLNSRSTSIAVCRCPAPSPTWKPWASEDGAPISSMIASPSSVWRRAYSAWMASSRSSRCSRVVCDQLAKALRAAATALFTSATPPSEMVPATASVAGLMTSAVFGSTGATHWPSI